MTEAHDVSSETLRLMSILAMVNCVLAALGVATAYYVYVYVPHPLEIHSVSKYGEVVSDAATYLFVFPVFQVLVFVLSVIGRWGAIRPHPLDNFALGEHFSRPPSREQACRVASLALLAFELVVLAATGYRAPVVATQVR